MRERSYILNFLSSNCRCAEAVKQNDVRKASRIIAELRTLTSPSGSGAQRMAHYFTDALVRFLPCLCTLLCISCKSLIDIVRFGYSVLEVQYILVCHLHSYTFVFSNLFLLNAFWMN